MLSVFECTDYVRSVSDPGSGFPTFLPRAEIGWFTGLLQRAVGYSMFANQDEQVAFFLADDETNDKMNGSKRRRLMEAWTKKTISAPNANNIVSLTH